MSDLVRSLARHAVWAAAIAAAGGCATGRSAFPPDRAARAAPATPAFVPASQLLPDSLPRVSGGAEPAVRVQGGDVAAPACAGVLVDPTDGTRLRLVRSQSGTRGDYEVPGGRFGVQANELLRVDCRTNRAIGIVPGRWRG
jgi:hypothetical protein